MPALKTILDLYGYQLRAFKHVLKYYGSMLWVDIGLGKTIIALTAAEHLLDSYKIRGVLVVAPLAVVDAVWEQEALIWGHTKHLTFSRVTGTAKQRLAALRAPANVYLTNYENLQWLVDTLVEDWIKFETPLPFDMLVLDEISKMKHATAKRCRVFAKILPYFQYRVGLTGTPASNGYPDLHGQYLMIDGGHRLGPNITGYRNRWLIQNEYSRKWTPRIGAIKVIQKKISDITLQMGADEYLSLPPLRVIEHSIELSKDLMDQYKEFEKEFFLALGDFEVEAFNAGAKSMKCRQLANGAVYVDDTRTTFATFHNKKLDALEDLVEELQGAPLLVCYQFRHDKKRIAERFPDAVFFDRTNVAKKIADWNAGKIKIFAGHPASMGHGLNLQHGGNHICWFGLPWNLEHYIQATGRIRRNGQKGEIVFSHWITVSGTIEKLIAATLRSKNATQTDLRAAVREYARSQQKGA